MVYSQLPIQYESGLRVAAVAAAEIRSLRKLLSQKNRPWSRPFPFLLQRKAGLLISESGAPSQILLLLRIVVTDARRSQGYFELDDANISCGAPCPMKHATLAHVIQHSNNGLFSLGSRLGGRRIWLWAGNFCFLRGGGRVASLALPSLSRGL